MDNSSDEISIESDPSKGSNPGGLKYVTHWPPVNIEFQDLVYSVPDMQGKFVYLPIFTSFYISLSLCVSRSLTVSLFLAFSTLFTSFLV